MKRFAAIFLTAAVAVAALAACGGNSASSSTPASTPSAPASTPASAATPDSQPQTEPDSTPASAAGDPTDDGVPVYDIDAHLATLVEAAQLGDTIPVAMLDLQAGGVDTANIANFVGAESKLSSENGGIVIVIQTQPGMAETVADDMISFRDSRMDDRYAEFATAMEHTGNAITSYNLDLVIYAVSAVDDYTPLADAVSGIFAELPEAVG